MVVAGVRENIPVREARGVRRREQPIRLPLAFIERRAGWKSHDLRRMDFSCTGCQALHWASEPSAKKPQGGEASYQSYYKRGDTQLERMRQLPNPLHALMNGTNTQSKTFRKVLRRWNGQFAFTSVKFNMD